MKYSVTQWVWCIFTPHLKNITSVFSLSNPQYTKVEKANKENQSKFEQGNPDQPSPGNVHLFL